MVSLMKYQELVQKIKHTNQDIKSYLDSYSNNNNINYDNQLDNSYCDNNKLDNSENNNISRHRNWWSTLLIGKMN